MKPTNLKFSVIQLLLLTSCHLNLLSATPAQSTTGATVSTAPAPNATGTASEFKEIHTITDLTHHLSTLNCLVIFDIDNTLLFPATDLGSDQWFAHLVETELKRGVDAHAALQTVLPLYFHVHFKIDLVPTEPDLETKLAQIHTKCHHAICLTARSVPLAATTITQLTKNGLTFPANPYAHLFTPTGHTFNLPQPHLYQQNVLFCGQNDKGAALLAYLDHVKYQPELIIFVDDKTKNLQSVAQAVRERGIDFIGLRYAGCDQRVQNFKYELTQQELQEFLIKHPHQTQST